LYTQTLCGLAHVFMKILFLSILVFLNLKNIEVNASVKTETEKLADIMSDQYSSFVEKSFKLVTSEDSDYVVALFTIEGFSQGNNYNQYLAAFIPEYKKSDQPPFKGFGDPKYRLIGHRQICESPLLMLKNENVTLYKTYITAKCESTRDNKVAAVDIKIEIGRFGIFVNK
jgi:hypothetical protein